MASPKSIHPTPLPPPPKPASHTTLSYGLPKILIPYLCLPHPPSNQYYQYVMDPPTNFQAMLHTSCNLLQKQFDCTSSKATISYNSFNHFHLLLMIPTHTTFRLLFHDLCIPYPITVLSYILPSCHAGRG